MIRGSGRLCGMAFAAVTALGCAGQSVPDPADLVIVDVNVLPMTADTVLMDHAVLVRHGRIAVVTPMTRLIVPAGAAVLDAGGRYLVPGLVDFHVHLRSERELDAYLRHGVTTAAEARAAVAEHVAAGYDFVKVYAGVPLLVATDASAPGMYRGKSAHVELAALHEAGLQPLEVLRVATRSADPRADLSVLARPWRVLRDGRPVYDGSR